MIKTQWLRSVMFDLYGFLIRQWSNTGPLWPSFYPNVEGYSLCYLSVHMFVHLFIWPSVGSLVWGSIFSYWIDQMHGNFIHVFHTTIKR